MGRGVYICMLGKVVYVWMRGWWVSGEGRGGRGVRYGYGRVCVCGCILTGKRKEQR